jgi:sugar phosphate isomerase/epimerase
LTENIMAGLKEFEIGVMFRAGGDPRETVREMKTLGVRAGQLGVPGGLDLTGQAEKWAAALSEEDFTVVTVFCSYIGETYTDVPTVQRTVGFIPPSTRDERERRTKEVSRFAAAIGVKSIGCHIGFVPPDTTDPDYQAVLGMVRRICDHAAEYGQIFCLETGQEPADTLLNFFRDVDRTNLGINFDPANMILYGTGDPIQALGVLAPHIVSVHCKDGEWPPKDVPGALGTEKPLGQGAVGIPQFIGKLRQIGYGGILAIEREVVDRDEKLRDVRAGIELLGRIVAETSE